MVLISRDEKSILANYFIKGCLSTLYFLVSAVREWNQGLASDITHHSGEYFQDQCRSQKKMSIEMA